MTIDSDTLFIVLIGGAAALTIGLIVHLEIKVRRLLLGKDGKSLEDSIRFARSELEKQAAWRSDIERYLANVEKRLGHMLHEAKTVRFNAFKGTGEGGNQSFATALLSEDGSGVVMSSIFTRDRVSVYAKPVEKHSSKYDLTEEERQAIELAAASVASAKRS